MAAPSGSVKRRGHLALLCLPLLGGCGVALEHGLSERQANDVLVALERAGITADKQAGEAPGQFAVVVGRDEVAHAVEILRAQALPRQRPEGRGQGLAESALLPSLGAERSRLAARLGSELEETLEALPRVVTARVHIALPPADFLPSIGARPRSTASVALQVQPDFAVAPLELQRLVAGAVEGLQPTDVALLLTPAATPRTEEPALARLGPLRVAAGSRSLTAALLSGLLLVIVGLAATVALLAVRLRRRSAGD